MNPNLFREVDQPAAQKEYDFILDCTMRVENHLAKGNYEQALRLTKDLQKSVQVLQQLIKKKEEEYNINEIAKQLVSLGVHASTISRLFKHKKAE